MKTLLCLSIIICMSSIDIYTNFMTNLWYHYKANNAYTLGRYGDADILYTKLLEQNPYDPEINYNLGLVLYKKGDYLKSLSYFDRTIQHAVSKSLLKEHAWFNKGCAYAKQKKWNEALDSFLKVIEINSDNHRAKHNIDYIKKLLEEQKNQQQNNSDNQQNSDNAHNDQQQSKQSDSSSNKNQNDQHNDNQQKQTEEKNSQHKTANNNQNDQNQSNKQSNSQSDKQSNKHHEQLDSSKQDIAKNLQKNEQTKKSDMSLSQDNSQQSDIKKQENKNNNSSAESKKLQNAEQSLADTYASQVSEQSDDRLDERAAFVIKKLQEQEDYVQKQLLKINVSKQGAGQHGQKNW